jgi:low temperature requirement protein LtrA
MSSNKSPKSVLVNPIVSRDVGEVHRTATPLELFYDLIYVIAIASLAAELHHALSGWHHVGQAIGMYFLIFFCIWWPWNTYTWFASGYDTDDAQFRLASFAQMIGVMIIAVGVKPAFSDNHFLIMMIGYVVMRIPYVLMWLKVAYDDPRSRPVALRYAIGVALVQIAWTLSVLYFNSWYLFVMLILFELFVPYFAEHSTDKDKNTKYHFDHIEERLGLLTIIVLGESVLASVHAFEQAINHFSNDLAMLVVGTILILFSMWWLYFDDKVESELGSKKKSFLWGYGHYFVYLFAAAVGALISVNVDVLTHHAQIDETTAVLGLALSIAGYLVSVWLCHDLLLDRKGFKKYELLILAALVVGIAILFQSILLMGIAFVILNAIRLIRRHRQFQSLQIDIN